MRIQAKTAGISFIVLMILGLVFFMTTGYWATESSKEPSKYSDGEFAGTSNPDDIRGSYSLEDIHIAFDIPVESLAAAFGLSDEENPRIIQVKIFEDIFGIIDGMEIGTGSMRYFVALYKGLPFVVEEGTALPKPAISILRKEGAMTEEELSMATENSVSLESAHETDTTSEVEHDDTVLMEIKGKTMFSELYDWGISVEELETILGMAVGARSMSVRDFCMDNGIEFSTVKDPVQVLLDNM